MIIQRKLYYESFIRLGLKKVLILGVNLGNLGFLSESVPEKLFEDLEKQNLKLKEEKLELQNDITKMETEQSKLESMKKRYSTYFDECELFNEDTQKQMGQILVDISELKIIYKEKDINGFMKIIDRYMKIPPNKIEEPK